MADPKDAGSVNQAASRRHSPQASSPPSKRRRVACSECRQSKVKCNDVFEGPCSRCRRLLLKCETVAGYKRVDRRSKMEEIENELQHLKSMVGQNETPVSSKDYPMIQTTNGSSVSSAVLQPNGPHIASTPNYSQLHMSLVDQGDPHSKPEGSAKGTSDADLRSYGGVQSVASPPLSNTASLPRTPRSAASSPRSIGAVSLSEAQIDYLFQIFFETYHPYLPILETLDSPDECYSISPLLFWAICSIASRRYPSDPGLLTSLSKPVTQLLWETISEPPILRLGVQAILLLVYWPFPSLNIMKHDPSLHLVTIAVNSAMQNGLHRPDFSHEFGIIRAKTIKKPPNGLEKKSFTKTWAACNIVAEHIISHNGHPPPVALFDWTIDRACELGTTYTLPDEIRHALIMQKLSHRTTKAMAGCLSQPSALPPDNERHILLKLFEADLESAEGHFGKSVSITNQLHVWGVRLHLFIFYFFESSFTEPRRLGIIKAYNAAETLIAKIGAGDTLFGMLETSPIYVFRMLFLSSAVLLKVLHSTYSRYVDFDAGQQAFNTAVAGLRRWSLRDADKGSRTAEMLSQLWSICAETNAKRPAEPSLRFNCRLATSIVYDLLWQWRESMSARGQFPQTSQNDGTVSATNEAGIEQRGPAQTSPFYPATEGPQATPLDLDLSLPWDDLDAIAFNWDWDLHGFKLPG